MDKTAKLAESSERTVQRNSVSRHNLREVSMPQIRGRSGIQPRETVQKDYTNKGTSPDPDGLNHDRPLKVTKTERF
jgi:hypothetical protein